VHARLALLIKNVHRNEADMKKKQIVNLAMTKRDLDIMNILWDSDSPKTASMIVQDSEDLTTNTVQAVLRKLLKNECIQVADIVYSGTVLTRSYKPLLSQEEFLLRKITSEYMEMNKKVSISSIIGSLLEAEKDTDQLKEDIAQLRELVEEYTRKYL